MATAASPGSYLTPSFENAVVSDAMRPGIISCTTSTPLVNLAQMMATNHIHCVAVTDPADGSWSVVSDLDVVAAAADAEDRDAGSVRAAEAPTVRADESLPRAAQRMTEHRITHLLVVDEAGQPVGFLSTLDIAGVVAWGRA